MPTTSTTSVPLASFPATEDHTASTSADSEVRTSSIREAIVVPSSSEASPPVLDNSISESPSPSANAPASSAKVTKPKGRVLEAEESEVDCDGVLLEFVRHADRFFCFCHTSHGKRLNVEKVKIL
ncbi:Protein of unknown function [Pyronema omphalodes CBS 100304]|uniref:Uncharacterized protein n=1 Tax=Pyronema omphalodes (strain CBS 100304) TaxID=1076935 RepID=U4LDT5_PYROM|nr:Protein of unknown function [Pyronema omphalodes CBS 100304]